ncbi:MAG: hypothetical protein HC933_11395 [Pleurocapsa sp. SU_196_0]|nr:hypothetical protein [Pleurocapsa sp. SU_196_0]
MIAVIGAGFALFPLRRNTTDSGSIHFKSEREELQDELNAALQQVTDLERAHAAGELDAEEFERLKRIDETRAAKLLGRIEALPQQVAAVPTARPTSFSRSLVALLVTGVVLGGLSAFAVPSLQRLALREGEAKLYDDSNKLLGLERQLSVEASANGQPSVATLEAFGDLAWELRDWERAAQAYSALLRLTPDNINAVSRYGQLLFFAGQNDQALTLLRAAAKFDNAEALLTIGNILFSAKNDPKRRTRGLGAVPARHERQGRSSSRGTHRRGPQTPSEPPIPAHRFSGRVALDVTARQGRASAVPRRTC